jgi:NAD(P)-dependent dehydrogenase (short-subunit alcohol dehydrogenase family)
MRRNQETHVISDQVENTAGASQELNGKIALVTGAARGIGNNIAAKLASRGATVVIADINAELGESAIENIASAGRVSYITVDLSSKKGSQQVIEATVEQHGRLDILVNNARSRPAGKPDLMSENEESWDATLSVTLKGTFFTSQAAIVHWEKFPTDGASIVNIASIASTLVTIESPAYHAAKAGVVQITRYLADAAGPMGVRVNAVAPGLIIQNEHQDRFSRDDNEAYRNAAIATHPIGRVGASDDIAEAVAFLASDRSSFVTGQIIGVDGGSSVQEHWSFLYRKVLDTK